MEWVAVVLLLLGQSAGDLPTEQPPDPQPVAKLTKLPELIHYVEAPYPEEALAEGREATVLMSIQVDVQGMVESIELLESGGEAFDRAAVEAAYQFVFTPAEAGALGPVPVRITYRYTFELRLPKTATATPTETAPPSSPPPEPINFSGLVKEAGFRKPVGFAMVELSISTTGTTARTTTTADELGRFAFRGVPPGEHVVSVSGAFFQRYDTKEEIRAGEALEVLYYLVRAERDPYAIVVRTKMPRKEVARRTLTLEEIERVPGSQGDAVRVIQNLPGVSRAPFGLGLLIVRGAPPQDTGVYFDGHLLPILFHFGGLGGFTSVINSRMLEAIDFYPGGFGPDHGRVSAGAVELRSRFAATDRVHGEAIVDVAGASVFLEGPVSSDEEDGAFVLALRRSYVDGVLAGIVSATDSSFSIAPRYYDYQVRYDRPFGGKDRMLTFLWYGSDDELVLLGDNVAEGAPQGTQSRTYFHRLNPRFTYQPDAETRLVISPIFGVDYSNAESTGDASGNDISILLKDWNAGVRVDGITRLSPWLKLYAGGDILYYLFETDSVVPALPRTKDFPSPLPTDAPQRRDQAQVPVVLASLYAEAEIELFDRLRIWPGLRLDLYDFEAESQILIDPRLVEGRTLAGIDPRLTARYEVNKDISIKGQAGLYRQPPFPTQMYVNADLPLQQTGQYSAGFEWQIIDKLSLDIQGFLRLQGDVPRFTTATELVDGEVRIVGYRPNGQRRSYGAELLLKLEKRWGLFGWIAYTLSKSEFRRDDEEWRTNFFFDQTHNLNIVASYELGLNWFFSVRFRYVTGGGLPKTEARWYDADRDQYRRELANENRRAPAFHQLDVRIDKRWVFDEWYLEAYLDVQNVYNHENTEFYIPSFDFKDEIPIPSLPVFPLIGIKGVF